MPSFEFTDDPMRWVFTGDSVTQGAAHTFGERDYVQLFEEHLRWNMGRRRDHVICTAVSGRTVADLAGDLQWSVLQYQPHAVSIMLGLNDCQDADSAPDEFVESYSGVIREIARTGVATVLHTPNRVRPSESTAYPGLSLYAEGVRTLARTHGCILIDHFRSWAKPEASGATAAWLGETCHPNAYGHRAIAKLLLHRLGMRAAASHSAALELFPHAGELDLE